MAASPKQFAILCTNLHYTAGPFENEKRAQIVADHLNSLSIEQEQANPNLEGCRYVVIPFYRMTLTSYDPATVTPGKVKMN